MAGDAADLDWSVLNFSGNAVYHFDVRRITPYATFGLGLERSHYDFKGGDPAAPDLSATEVAINFGGGVKYPVSERWIARADIRRFQANDLAPDYWRVYGGVTFWVKR